MNNKITFPELIELVAKKANTSKRVSELFLKELVATATQTLLEGENVKIKGLGTLKLTRVGARKSVDVNTGDEIEIPGHVRLSFVADKALAEAVNQPFAHFETEVLSDDVSDEELAGIDDEMKTAHDEKPKESVVESVSSIERPPQRFESEEQAEADVEDAIETLVHFVPGEAPAQKAASDEVDVDDEKMAEEESPKAVEMPPAFVPPTESRQSTQEQRADEQFQEPEIETESEPGQPCEQDLASATKDDDVELQVENEISKRKHGYRMFLAGFVLGVITSLVVAWVSYRLYMMKCGPKIAQTEMSRVQASKQPAKPMRQVKSKPVTTVQQSVAPSNHESSRPVVQKPAVKPVVKETVNASTTLTRLARKHYGNNFFWVYIYEENNAKIKDPNNIPLGTEVVIPPAEKYGIDKSNPASVAKAKEKIKEIYNRRAEK